MIFDNFVPFLFSSVLIIILTAIGFLLPRLIRRIYNVATVLFFAVISALIIPITKYSRVRVISVLLALIAGITGFTVCKNTYFSEKGALVWDSTRTPLEIYESFSDSRTCLHMVGLYQYTFRDISNATGFTDFIENLTSGDVAERLDKFYDNKEIDSDNEMTGIFEEKALY